MQHVRSSVQDAGSWPEIDAAAFESNVRNLLSMIGDRALLCAVVKSHAYGHGADLLLPSLVRLGVPFIGVGSNEEAAIARRCGFEGRILRVRAAAPQEIRAGLRHDIEELVADPQRAWEIHEIAAVAGKVVRIHLDINSSGISRHSLDVSSSLGRASAVGIVSHPGLQLAGIMTHFPKDDDGSYRNGSFAFPKPGVDTASTDRNSPGGSAAPLRQFIGRPARTRLLAGHGPCRGSPLRRFGTYNRALPTVFGLQSPDRFHE